jgi:hypothetical protein
LWCQMTNCEECGEIVTSWRSEKKGFSLNHSCVAWP